MWVPRDVVLRSPKWSPRRRFAEVSWRLQQSGFAMWCRGRQYAAGDASAGLRRRCSGILFALSSKESEWCACPSALPWSRLQIAQTHLPSRVMLLGAVLRACARWNPSEVASADAGSRLHENAHDADEELACRIPSGIFCFVERVRMRHARTPTRRKHVPSVEAASAPSPSFPPRPPRLPSHLLRQGVLGRRAHRAWLGKRAQTLQPADLSRWLRSTRSPLADLLVKLVSDVLGDIQKCFGAQSGQGESSSSDEEKPQPGRAEADQEPSATTPLAGTVCHRCNFSWFLARSRRGRTWGAIRRARRNRHAQSLLLLWPFLSCRRTSAAWRGPLPQSLRADFVGGGGKRRASDPQPFSKMANLGPREFPGGSQTKRFAGMFPRSGANSSLLSEASEAHFS